MTKKVFRKIYLFFIYLDGVDFTQMNLKITIYLQIY